MDADTRHQLKQNDFAQALKDFAGFNDKRTWAWTAAILAIILLYAGYKYVGWRERANRLSDAVALDSINIWDDSQGDLPVNQLRELLARTGEPDVKALIRFKLGQALELSAKDQDAAKLAEAESEYKQILDATGVVSSVKAASLYRLALIKETQQDFTAAREHLNELSQNPHYAGSPFVDMATLRLDHLDKLAEPVVMLPGLRPEPEPASAPAEATEDTAPVVEESTPTPPASETAAEPPAQPAEEPAAQPEPDKPEQP